MEKLVKTEQLGDLDPDFFEGTVTEIIERIQRLVNRHGPSYSEIMFDWDRDGDIWVYGTRLETDKELQDRIEIAAFDEKARMKEAANKEKRERALYNKLKKKYEK